MGRLPVLCAASEGQPHALDKKTGKGLNIEDQEENWRPLNIEANLLLQAPIGFWPARK
jgi:hypothetical protein